MLLPVAMTSLFISPEQERWCKLAMELVRGVRNVSGVGRDMVRMRELYGYRSRVN